MLIDIRKKRDNAALKTVKTEAHAVDLKFSNEFLKLDRKLKCAFNTIKEEFEDHLDAINENTDEIQLYFDHLCEIEAKIDKLNERIDDIQHLLGQYAVKTDITLGLDEQKIFLLLYTYENGFLGFDEIVDKTHISSDNVRKHITSMLDKGVQLIREISDGKLFLKLNPVFKARQVKENIVRIDPSVVSQMENKVLGSFF